MKRNRPFAKRKTYINKILLFISTQIGALSLFFSSVFLSNALLIPNNTYVSYQISDAIKKNPNGIGLSVYTKNKSSDIIWKNSGYVGYELGYRYETNNSKAFFISNMIGSTCSYWFSDYQIDSIKKTISPSEVSYLYRNKYSGDYLGMECDIVLNNINDYWEQYDGEEYCFITENTAKLITKNEHLPSFNELMGRSIAVKKQNDYCDNLIIAGVLSQSSAQPYYQIYGDFILSHQSNIVRNLDSFGISVKYSKPDTQGINKQINFLDKLLKNDSEYVYNIDINSNKCRPIDRDTPKRNLLYLLPAALLFIGVDLPLYLLRNKIRCSFKTTHIVFMFSALFWLVIFQVASISIFSLTHLVFDSYSIFFVFTIFVIATTFFAWFIKKTRKNYVIDYSYFKI